MTKKSLLSKQYRDKHSYAPEEYNGLYIPWEDIIIWTQKHPETNEHLTLAQIAKARARTLRSVEGRKRWLKKHPGYRLTLFDQPDDHYSKLDEAYTKFIKGLSYADISTVS